MGLIEGPFFVTVRVMVLDCRYSSISEAEGLEVIVGAEVGSEDNPTVVNVSETYSPVFLRFLLSFLDEWSSETSSRLLRFFLRGSSEAGMLDGVSLV